MRGNFITLCLGVFIAGHAMGDGDQLDATFQKLNAAKGKEYIQQK